MKRSQNILSLVCLSFLIGCLEPISLDLPDGQSRRVVYGWISDKAGDSQVKLSWSNSFNSNQAYETIDNADVYVRESGGRQIDFLPIGDGVYLPSVDDMELQMGIAYRLWVITEGDTLISSFEIPKSTPPIDSAFTSFLVDPEQYAVNEDQENYYLSALINDEEGTRNYYRWKIYVNGELQSRSSDLFLFDDLFTDGNRFRVDASNVLFALGDSISFEQYSLTSGAYEYYEAIQAQTANNTLGPNAKPTNIVGNMQNISDPDQEIFGYFGASQVQLVSSVRNDL